MGLSNSNDWIVSNDKYFWANIFLSSVSRIVYHYKNFTYKMSCNLILLYLKIFPHLKRFWHVNLCKIVLCLQLPQIYGVCGCNQLNWRVSHQDNELCDYDGILSLWEDHFLFHLNFQPRTCWCFDGDSQLIFCDGNVINHDTTIVFQVFMIMLQSPVGKWGLSNMTQSTCVASTHQKNHRLCHNQPFDTNYDFFSPSKCYMGCVQ